MAKPTRALLQTGPLHIPSNGKYADPDWDKPKRGGKKPPATGGKVLPILLPGLIPSPSDIGTALEGVKNVRFSLPTHVDGREKSDRQLGDMGFYNFNPNASGLLPAHLRDWQYGIQQRKGDLENSRLYQFSNIGGRHDGVGFRSPDIPEGESMNFDSNGWPRTSAKYGWATEDDIKNAGASLYNGYAPVFTAGGKSNGGMYNLTDGRQYFTDGMSIRNTASPDHWRYKWFKQQEDDNYAWRESERDRIYDLWDRGEISDKERRKQRSDMLEKFRMNDRKWNHGMSEGYKVPAHIRALYAVGLLKGY